jgi:hypothetical protein
MPSGCPASITMMELHWRADMRSAAIHSGVSGSQVNSPVCMMRSMGSSWLMSPHWLAIAAGDTCGKAKSKCMSEE